MDRSSGANRHEEAWRRLNPGWDLKRWNDHSCLNFVRGHFPEYLEAYQSLGATLRIPTSFSEPRYSVPSPSITEGSPALTPCSWWAQQP